MKISAKIVHAENVADYLVNVIQLNKGALEVSEDLASLKISVTESQLKTLIEHAIRKILHDTGAQNNAVIVVAEKDYDSEFKYPYFSLLPENKKLI